MKKVINIKICNHNPSDPFSYGHFILNILNKYFEVHQSDNPDYLFYNDSTYEHLDYTCVKIFFTGENIYPNWNFCDYAIGFDHMNFGDRFYRMPLYLLATLYRPDELELSKDIDFTKQLSMTKEDLAEKKDFCSYVYSNYNADPERKVFFDKLSAYKKVNAGGACENNVGGRVDNKLAFESRHKFSIAFENSSRSGYTTEKIVTSIMARTIPIYWGNPDIGREFNEKRFINCHMYKDFDDVVEKIKEIDSNNDLYLSIVNQPVQATDYNFEKIKIDFEAFVLHIFEQDITKARRIRLSKVKSSLLNKAEKAAARYVRRRAIIHSFLSRIYQPFKRVRVLERIKQKYLRKIL